MSRLDKLRSQWSDKRVISLNGVPTDSSPDTIFHLCSAADPTPTHKYVGWILKSWSSDCFHYEDICMGASSRIADQLRRFETHKRLIPDTSLRSIMKYRSPGELDSILDSVRAPSFSSSRKQMKKEAWLLGETQSLRFDILGRDGHKCKLIIPLSALGSKVAGHDTRWCTAGDNFNMFKDYVLDFKGTNNVFVEDKFNPLCIIEMPRNPGREKPLKYQFYFSGKGRFTFMDSRDVTVSPDFIKELDSKGLLDAIDSFLVSNSFWGPDISFSSQCRLLLKNDTYSQEETPSSVNKVVMSRPIGRLEKVCIRGIEGAQYLRGLFLYKRTGDYQSLDFYNNEIVRIVSGYNRGRYNIHALIKKMAKLMSLFFVSIKNGSASRVQFYNSIKAKLDGIKLRKSDILLLCDDSYTLNFKENCSRDIFSNNYCFGIDDYHLGIYSNISTKFSRYMVTNLSRYMVTLLGSEHNYDNFLSCNKVISFLYISRQYKEYLQTVKLMNSGLVDFEYLYSKHIYLSPWFFKGFYTTHGFDFNYMLMAPKVISIDSVSEFIINTLLFSFVSQRDLSMKSKVNSVYFDTVQRDLIGFLSKYSLHDHDVIYKNCLHRIIKSDDKSYMAQSILVQLTYVLLFQTESFSDFVVGLDNDIIKGLIPKLGGFLYEKDGGVFLEFIYNMHLIEPYTSFKVEKGVDWSLTKPFLRYYFDNDKAGMLGSKFARHDNSDIRAQYLNSVLTYCLSRLMQYDKGCSLSMADRETKAPEIISRYLALDSQMEQEIEALCPGFLKRHPLSSPDFLKMVSEMKEDLTP